MVKCLETLTVTKLLPWIMAILTGSGISIEAMAQACSNLSGSIDDARTQLSRARNSRTLSDAKDYARRAKSELEDAESAANDCNCPAAASDFDDSARHARRARDADSTREFSEELNRAIRDFNSALDSLRQCGRSGR